MRFAKEYASRYYPNQQIVFALHKEHCKEDHTYRYAIHMVINRSNIVTGKRLAEGTGAQAKRNRANRVRTMDKEWGLQQVEEGVQNSKVHAKQPSKIEKEIESRGVRSYKTNLRELCRIAAQRATNLVEYRELLEGRGVDTQFRRGRMYVTDTDNARYSFSVTKLDASLNRRDWSVRSGTTLRAAARMGRIVLKHSAPNICPASGTPIWRTAVRRRAWRNHALDVPEAQAASSTRGDCRGPGGAAHHPRLLARCGRAACEARLRCTLYPQAGEAW